MSNKYLRAIKDVDQPWKEVAVDVYSVLDAYGITSQAVGHAVKKLLMAGQRGHKDYATDLREAIQAIERELAGIAFDEMTQENQDMGFYDNDEKTKFVVGDQVMIANQGSMHYGKTGVVEKIYTTPKHLFPLEYTRRQKPLYYVKVDDVIAVVRECDLENL